MSEQQEEQDRSEEATPFKLQRARERGSVARGADLGFFTGLSAFLICAWFLGDDVNAKIALAAAQALAAAPGVVGSPSGVLHVTGTLLLSAARPLSLMVGAVFLTVLVFEIVQLRGIVFSGTPLKPDFNRLSPAQGFKRVFSVRMLIETGKTMLKMAVYLTIAAFMVLAAWASAPALIDAGALASGMIRLGLQLIAFFVLAALAFAILDQVISRRDFQKRMRMSRREVKREHRDREGDPRLKQKRKDLHKDFAKASRSLRGIRGADVLITNPTHFAVALRYDPRAMDAPTIVSRGANQFALRLRRLAFLYAVPVVENPPLARALHRFELDRPVPDVLFEPVAEIYRALNDAGALRKMSRSDA